MRPASTMQVARAILVLTFIGGWGGRSDWGLEPQGGGGRCARFGVRLDLGNGVAEAIAVGGSGVQVAGARDSCFKFQLEPAVPGAIGVWSFKGDAVAARESCFDLDSGNGVAEAI